MKKIQTCKNCKRNAHSYGAIFCYGCGHKLPELIELPVCKCGFEVSSSYDKFCINCGEAV